MIFGAMVYVLRIVTACDYALGLGYLLDNQCGHDVVVTFGDNTIDVVNGKTKGGGVPAACNRGLFGEKKEFNRYPLNELSATIVNTLLAYTLYIVGIFCHDSLWVGIFIAYFTMAQVLMHCLKLNISLRAWYSPGCFSALFVMLPMGVYYICYIATHFTVPHYYWWGPIVAFPFVSVVMILLPIITCRSRKTTFGFASYQAEEFEVRHGIASLFHK
jgi:hypothetical protein